MSIPYWREQKYTDDGCSIYECLNCYSTWESRSAPWWSETGEKPDIKGIWNFCPVCGCRWIGQKKDTKEKIYYPYHRRYNTDRLFPLTFRIIRTYTEGNYVSSHVESDDIRNPALAIKELRELREGFSNHFSYHIEPIRDKNL